MGLLGLSGFPFAKHFLILLENKPRDSMLKERVPDWLPMFDGFQGRSATFAFVFMRFPLEVKGETKASIPAVSF